MWKIGLNYLYRIPSNRLFQLFVDGCKHFHENGPQGFEKREPGCMQAFYKGLIIALQSLDKKVDLHLLLKIHEAVTSGVGGRLNSLIPGRFRNDTMSYFGVTKTRCTKEGIIELKTYFQREDLSPCAKLLVTISEQEEDLFKLTNNVIASNIDIIYQNSKKRLIAYKPPGQYSYEFKKKVKRILNRIQQGISNIKNDPDAVIRVIARGVKSLELLHPFADANGRVFVNILLNFLLMQNGFPPATFYEPNIFDLYATDQLVVAIKDAMNHTLFVINNPEAKLYNFDVKNVKTSQKLKTEIERICKPNLMPSIQFKENLKQVGKYLLSTFTNKYKLHCFAALGNVDEVKRHLPKNKAPYPLAPEGFPPLHKGKSPLHIACVMNHEETVECLINHCPDSVNQPDSEGNTALHYAFEISNTKMVDFLLSKGAKLQLKNKSGASALTMASMYLSSKALDKYLNKVDINTFDLVPLLIKSGITGNVDVAIYLLENRNLKKALLSDKDHFKSLRIIISTLNKAAYNGYGEFIIKISKTLYQDKKLPFEIAGEILFEMVRACSLKDIKELLEYSQAPSKEDDIDFDTIRTSLHYDHSDKKAIYLVGKAFNIKKIKSHEGERLLGLAAILDRVPFAKALIKAGVDVNKKDSDGFTALHKAVESNSLDMIHYLCSQPGINIDISYKPPGYSSGIYSPSPQTAIMLAIQKGNVEATRLLLEKSAKLPGDLSKTINSCSKNKDKIKKLLLDNNPSFSNK